MDWIFASLVALLSETSNRDGPVVVPTIPTSFTSVSGSCKPPIFTIEPVSASRLFRMEDDKAAIMVSGSFSKLVSGVRRRRREAKETMYTCTVFYMHFASLKDWTNI
ncbi:hypothetical protein Droror1_Dr00021369 [Drosera rotundifolia]